MTEAEADVEEVLEVEDMDLTGLGSGLLARRPNISVSLGALRESSLASESKSTLLTSREAVGVE